MGGERCKLIGGQGKDQRGSFPSAPLPSPRLTPQHVLSRLQAGPGCTEPGLCISTAHGGHAPPKSGGTFLLWLSIPRNAERVS